MLIQSTLLNVKDISKQALENVKMEMQRKGYSVTVKTCGQLTGIRCGKTETNVSITEECVTDGNEICVRMVRSRFGYVEGDEIGDSELIPLLYRNGCIGADGEFKSLDKPTSIERGNLKIMADVVNGKVIYKLPVVFVSKNNYDELAVDVYKLSKRLFGLAHVIYEQSASTSPTLRNMTNGQNVHHGAIGIYYPDKECWRIIPDRQTYKTADIKTELAERIVHFVRKYGRERRIDERLTWEGLSSAILDEEREKHRKTEEERQEKEREIKAIKDGLEGLKTAYHKQAVDEADKLLDSFERDYQDMQNLNERLLRENEKLKAENEGLKSRSSKKGSMPLVFSGNEPEYYPGELSNIILSVLSSALKTLEDGSRRKDVILDILEENGYGEEADKKAEEIKALMRSYEGLNGKLEEELKNLGIVITDEGKHYKLTYHGDGRYQMALSRTPSDMRTGKNGGAYLAKTFF